MNRIFILCALMALLLSIGCEKTPKDRYIVCIEEGDRIAKSELDFHKETSPYDTKSKMSSLTIKRLGIARKCAESVHAPYR